MSEQYLPVRESLGYRQLKEALWDVFHVNLDEIQIDYLEHDGYENFDLLFHYKEYEMTIGIYATGKNMQFEYGEGGHLSISFPNPEYPHNSSFNWLSFPYLLKDEELREAVKYAFGKKEGRIKRAVQILKDYLDSDDAKVLLKQ